MTLTLYGIRNCDTVKKARAWLDAAGVAYVFHDYKVAGADQAMLAKWVEALGWEAVLNRAGTTFRALRDADRAAVDAAKAVALMAAQPSMIRRPILEGRLEGRPVLLAGFRPEDYDANLR
ncbi:MAG: ArsC family reductase [Sandarakinorhabdus sp.]|nr:ArsC family reductase [Sandarakinorhabdus sp.]